MAQLYKDKKSKKGKKYTLAEMLANPRLRGQLPDSKLPANLLAVRKENKRKKAPAGPGSSLTVGAVEDMLKPSFGGAESFLNQRKTEIPTWFNTYRNELNNATSQQAAQQTAAQAAFKGLGASAAQNAQMANTQTNQQTAAANAISGSTAVDPQVALRQQAAENVRQTGIGGFAGLSKVLADNQQGFLQGEQSRSYGLQSNANSELNRLVTDLAAKKSSAYQDILGQESKSKLENYLATGNLQDKAADNKRADAALKETQRSHRANETAAERRLRLAQEKAANGGKPKSKYLSQGQQNSFADKVERYKSEVSKYKKGGTKADRARVAKLLTQGLPSSKDPATGQTVPGVKPVSSDLALKIALDLSYDGKLSKKYKALLKSKGYKANQFG